MLLAIGLWTFARALVHGAAAVTLENLALRHQLVVLQRSVPRPKLHRRDRVFWVCFSRLWRNWRSTLFIVQPATVLAWHRQSFRLYWRWKSRSAPLGRPPIDAEIQDLIRRMAGDNPTWGRRRIHAELTLLGYKVAALTVAKYIGRMSPPPSRPGAPSLRRTSMTWWPSTSSSCPPSRSGCSLPSSFSAITAVNSSTSMSRPTRRPSGPPNRSLKHSPTTRPLGYLVRDRDSIYSDTFHRRVDNLGIHQVPIAPHAPWQNPFAERVIGSIHRECLDHFIVLNERHLRRLLRAYLAYYNTTRPHQALGNNSPHPREVQPAARGSIVALPLVGGLHHRYQRAA